MTDQESGAQEAIDRANEALSKLADSFHRLAPQFEKAKRALDQLAYYAPIPVEGTVK